MSEGFPYQLTLHAAKVISEREIPKEWIVRVLSHPTRIDPDRNDLGLRHALSPIPDLKIAYFA